MLGEIIVSPFHFYVKHFPFITDILRYLTTHIASFIPEKHHDIRTAVSADRFLFNQVLLSRHKHAVPVTGFIF